MKKRSTGTSGTERTRSEPSARGCFRKRVDFSNLDRRPDRMLSMGRNLERNRGRDSGLYAPHTPGNSHCGPTTPAKAAAARANGAKGGRPKKSTPRQAA